MHYNKNYSLDYLRKLCFASKDGVSLSNINEASIKIGFDTQMVRLSIEQLIKVATSPVILFWKQKHYVVLYQIKKGIFYIADPAHGKIRITQADFTNSWLSQDNNKGIALLLSPNTEFYKLQPIEEKKPSYKELFGYFSSYKKQLAILSVLLLLGSGLTLIFPFLTKNLIDKGIAFKDVSLITLILLAQLGVFIGNTTIEIIRSRVVLYLGTNLSIKILSDFFKKLLKLPIKFFETKMLGDFNQRIQDNERVEGFLTSQSLNTFFSMVVFLVFFVVLWYYDSYIILLYTLFTIASLVWSFFWYRKRAELDYLHFQLKSENQESIFEIINGVTELKLNQFEEAKRIEWERTQLALFDTNIKILKIDQLQLIGYDFINQVKNILVTFLSAILVVNGKMTIGELLAISYIIGQLNSPIKQLLSFFRSLQDATLSLNRLHEIQNETPEEMPNYNQIINSNADINIQNLSFQYEGPQSPFVLENINLTIPKGQITAIVGASGSGKTTLMKLLLRFYEPTSGNIFIGTENLNSISPKSLRQNCGVVMQDGYIFADSIERNIATSDENINTDKLQNAVITANIAEYINELPLKYKTKIGASGNGISGGQKQRMLIARAVYKNPNYIFFDEATSALDAENEKIIHENLQTFFKGKTVLIIAHRLSTVKNADQIIVLDKGKIAETGTHEQLTTQKGKYYELVKNQLELGE